MLRIAPLLFAVSLMACATPAPAPAAQTPIQEPQMLSSDAPLEGAWDVTTTTRPDSGCDFSGQAFVHAVGGNVAYNVIVIGDYRCPDGRNEHREELCSAYDMAVLLINCDIRRAGGENVVGDQISMQRPNMQSSVEDMDGFLRLPDAESARFTTQHALHWHRTSRTISGLTP